MNDLCTTLVSRFKLTIEQAEMMTSRYDEGCVKQALSKTKTDSWPLMKMNLNICKKYYFSVELDQGSKCVEDPPHTDLRGA